MFHSSIPLTSCLLFVTDEAWEEMMRKNTSEPSVSIPLTSLKVDSQYQFRVIAINNKKGIGQPSPPSEYFTVPGEFFDRIININI